jgi:hypothetical protein
MKWEETKIAQAIKARPNDFPGDNGSGGKFFLKDTDILWESVGASEYLCFGLGNTGAYLLGYKGVPATQYSSSFGCGRKNVQELWDYLQTEEGKNHVKGGYKLDEFISFLQQFVISV